MAHLIQDKADRCGFAVVITYVRLVQVDVFLAVVMDAFSRRIVGWNLAPRSQPSSR